ncbi:MAG TPA: glycine--tRNA ligase [bacterium]|nr:glycine--tRNA ligase [bacterium]HQG44239.1 glycine--tRNA ligase [bacterium]HQI47615.1 glycine--tRNA ligase [bacterium]HQJ63608.1 glycine--tRNA ligase [bacterium]
MANPIPNTLDKIISLCRRRGFIFQSSEIYGGLNACYDYGPLGVELKRNIKDFWWNWMVRRRRDVVGLDAAILMAPRVWEASGHVAGFTDPMVDCKVCKRRFRADLVPEPGKCPECGGQLTDIRQFNLMFKTFMGPVEESASVVYLRPETAQGIYVNYQNVLDSSRLKVPFGIGQIGKAFRNEITTENFIFRTREFEQMEMQYFVKPGTDMEWFETWKQDRKDYYAAMGIRTDKIRFHQHGPDELAHYAAAAFDIQYEFPFGWKELEGIHNRTDFDLKRHQEYSGVDLSYFDEVTRERYIPYIIETSAGVDRTMLCILSDAFEEQELEKDTRTVLHFHPAIAPVKAGIFPLVKKDGMPEMAHEIEALLQPYFAVFYDESGAVGRRYRRQDEIGTPFCLTVDTESLQNETVTVRDRDTMQQERLKIADLAAFLHKKIHG